MRKPIEMSFVIAPHTEDAALLDRAIYIQNVIRRPTPDIDDERAEVFLMLGEHDLGGGERGENDVLHFEGQFLHATDRVLNARPHTVDDVEIRFEFLAEHAHGVENAVNVIMLDDGMEEGVLRGNAHLPCVDFHVLNVLLVHFVAIFRQHDTTAIIETLDVGSGDADIDAADHDVAFCLSVDHGFVHAFHRCFEIDDLALAHTTRWRLAHAKNLDCAVLGDGLRPRRHKFLMCQLRLLMRSLLAISLNPFCHDGRELPFSDCRGETRARFSATG